MRDNVIDLIPHARMKHRRVQEVGNLSCDLEHMRSAVAMAQGWESADLGENKLCDLGYGTPMIN